MHRGNQSLHNKLISSTKYALHPSLKPRKVFV